ncbi:ras-related protein ORAB-1-like [Malaclemys terrapin pileata]|uniref:ras-related protein ORAB-1-like n=1 Tax=Malaclemys terrapin pileata TaxID=2991368 RepID=UPI0023A86C79|nr:ras-related protein ORAB-1-like [Malaclemys terrapin pileata]
MLADDNNLDSSISTTGVGFKIRTIKLEWKTIKLQIQQIFPEGRARFCGRGWVLSEPLPGLIQQISNMHLWLETSRYAGKKVLDYITAKGRPWEEQIRQEDVSTQEVLFLETSPKNATNMERASVTMAAELKNRAEHECLTFSPFRPRLKAEYGWKGSWKR